MKKFLSIFMCAAGVFYTAAANYTVDFNTSIDTTDPAFKVAPGWKHLVHTGSYSSQKVNYTYVTDQGEDGTGALQSGAQSYFDYFEYANVPLFDLIVTPPVGGNVTIDVKTVQGASDGFIEFYKVTEVGGQLVRGDKLTLQGEDLVPMFYTTVTVPSVEDGTMLGLRCNNVYIDNFTAERVNLVMNTEVTITASSATNTGAIDCNADNKFEIGGTVTFKNTGDLDVTPGTVNFLLAMMKSEAGNYVVDKVVGTFPINETIAVGATSSPINFATLVNESDVDEVDGSKARRYDIICDKAPASRIFGNFEPVPYRPIPVYSTPVENNLKPDCVIDLGLISGSGSQILTIANNGAAEMIIQSIAVTGEGFSSNPTASISIPKHETKEIEISLSSENYGEKTGSITINATGLDPVTFNLKGNVIDPSLWYVNFEDGNMPGNMVAEDGWAVASSLAISPNKYYAIGTNELKPAKLISPLLTTGEGEKISFEAARNHNTSFINIYTSTDRVNWTKIRTLSDDAENDADKLSSEYNGLAWGTNTKYVFTTFTLSNLPNEQFYLAFEAGNARVDNILGGHVVDVDHDMYISQVIAPANAMVNNEVTVKATVKNLLTLTETADSYQLELYNGEELLAETENIDIEGYDAAEFSFAFTPHQIGELSLKVVFTKDDYKTESSEFIINVSEELALQTKQIGNVTDTETNKTSPINFFNSKSQSETVYKAELIGLSEGTKITKLVFKGKSGQSKNFDANIKVWLQNTDDDVPSQILLDEEATAKMTLVFDGTYKVNVTANEPTDLLVFELAEPFIYDGKNLRVAMEHSSQGWFTSYYEIDKSVSGQSIMRSSDSKLGNFNSSPMPVMYVDAAKDPYVLKGNVNNTDGEAVANAKVLIESGNVQYVATTDETGKYSMNVFQNSLEYVLKVTADGYKIYTSDLILENQETEKNIILEKDVTDGIEVINDDYDSDFYYDLNGIRLSEKPKRGMYIYKGKVYLAE